MSLQAASLKRFLAVAAALVLAGCGESERPSRAGTRTDAKTESGAEELDLPLSCEPVRSFCSGLELFQGIAIDGYDRVYLAGRGGVRVVDGTGTLLREWSTAGTAVAIAVGEEGKVYVAGDTRVEVFDAQGQRLTAWGEEGRDRGQFGVVTGLAVHGMNLYVADAGNRCVHRFAVNGDFITEIGKRDLEAGVIGIVTPSPYLDCDVDGQGTLHVTNPGRLRVEQYSPNGELLGHWGEAGLKPGQFSGCCNPTNLVLLSDDRIAAADKLPPRVKVYTRQGNLLGRLGPEHFAKDAAGLDLGVDSQGLLYVADPGSGRVHVFALKE
jgi:hypothetical protein